MDDNWRALESCAIVYPRRYIRLAFIFCAATMIKGILNSSWKNATVGWIRERMAFLCPAGPIDAAESKTLRITIGVLKE